MQKTSLIKKFENMNEKMEKYHFEEIILILLIVVSDLSKYEEEDIVAFSEDIEGRIDTLFNKDFLLNLNENYGFSSDIIANLEIIRIEIHKLYKPQWHKELYYLNLDLKNLANTCLHLLNTQYVEPKKFAETHLDINW